MLLSESGLFTLHNFTCDMHAHWTYYSHNLSQTLSFYFRVFWIPLYNIASEFPLYNIASEFPLYNIASEFPLYNIPSEFPLYNIASEFPLYNIASEFLSKMLFTAVKKPYILLGCL